jgi:hypothetical protein
MAPDAAVQRSSRTQDDLTEIGWLLHRAYAAQPNWNTYSFARFDIWAQRRIADAVLFDKPEWQQDSQLWESGGSLMGAVFFESLTDAVLIGDPAYPMLIESMLAWAEARYPGRAAISRCDRAMEAILYAAIC